jgi:hypothetical protein
VRQTEEKKNARRTRHMLTKKLEQTYYFALFFGKKQQLVAQTIS